MYCVDCPELMRKEQGETYYGNYISYVIHPKGRLNDVPVLWVEESSTARLHTED